VPTRESAGTAGAALSYTLLHCKDVMKQVQWYARVLGFEILGEASPFWAELATGSTRLSFHSLDSKLSDEQLEQYRKLGSLCFSVPCIDEFHTHLVKEKVKVVAEPKNVSHGDEKPDRYMASYEDPEGINFTTCEFRF